MKHIIPLLIIAVMANLLTWALYDYVAGQPGGNGTAMAFIVIWMPILWLISIVLAIIISIIKRKHLFQKQMLGWTCFTLLFTTPIPAIAFFNLTRPGIKCSGTMINPIDGKVFKTESWNWTSTDRKFVDKYFVADSAQEAAYGDEAFKRYGTWTYLKDNGDTLKLEYYKKDSLIAIKKLK